MGQRYREMGIRTESPVGLVVRMYEGALDQVRRAREQQRLGRAGERGAAVSRALAIVAELRQSLDLERGGDIAKNLDALYEFVSNRLLDGNLRGEEAPLGEALSVLETLRGAFAEIARRPEAAQPPGRAA